MSEKIGILGAGGQADEVALFAGRQNVAFNAVNEEYIVPESEGLIDVNNPNNEQLNNGVIAAIGAPAVRRAMVESWPGHEYVSVVAETAYVGENTRIGEGCIVGPRAVLTSNVEVGRHSLINVGSSISHDCRLGEYTTVSPGAHIGGKVVIGDGAFIGIGAIISNNVHIASGVVIGAGAVVIKDADVENGVYIGAPARLLRQNEGWLREL